MTLRILRDRDRRHESHRRAAVERGHHHRAALVGLTQVQKTAAVRQKRWLNMPTFALRGVRGSDHRGLASARRDPQDAWVPLRADEDDIGGIPRAAVTLADGTQLAKPRSVQRHHLQPAGRKESHRVRVGRPEGVGRSVRAFDDPGVQVIKGADPEKDGSALDPGCRIGEMPPIRRHLGIRRGRQVGG